MPLIELVNMIIKKIEHLSLKKMFEEMQND